MKFLIQATEGKSRAGILDTSHGQIRTPAFMPVGTQASVKALTPEDLRAIGAEIVLSNTYHLSLRPGIQRIQSLGGLHNFMNWHGPILTDSGGFQVFSLGHLRQLTEEGARFRSHIDGSEHFLTPELAVQYQEALGSDIGMVLDHCPAYGETTREIEEATERTSRWATRSVKAWTRNEMALFGIIQGGWSSSIRRRSAEVLTSLDLPGYAIGGVSVGEPKALAYQAVKDSVPYLPPEKPRYLMGVGAPEDLLTCIGQGIDMFDCTLPTRVARNGGLFTRNGRINLRNSRYADQSDPIEEDSECYVCSNYSAAYLYHLLRSGELLYHRLASLHNLHFVLKLVRLAREAIMDARFTNFSAQFLEHYRLSDETARLAQKGGHPTASVRRTKKTRPTIDRSQLGDDHL